MENARLHDDTVRSASASHATWNWPQRCSAASCRRPLPQVAGYEFFAHYESAQQVGGDYYGFIPLTERPSGPAMGDVAGKGVPAALLMAKLSTDTRFACWPSRTRPRRSARLNDLLYAFTSRIDRFVTLAAVVLDPARHTATMVSAGHVAAPVFTGWRTTGRSGIEEKAGLPLGIMEGYTFDSCELELEPGESLLIFTDGVTDAMDVQGNRSARRASRPPWSRPGSERDPAGRTDDQGGAKPCRRPRSF